MHKYYAEYMSILINLRYDAEEGMKKILEDLLIVCDFKTHAVGFDEGQIFQQVKVTLEICMILINEAC